MEIELINKCINLAKTNVLENNGGPFGAIIADQKNLIK